MIRRRIDFPVRSSRQNIRRRNLLSSVERLESRMLLAAGALDRSFGFDGIRTVAFDISSPVTDQAKAVVVQNDNKILVAGTVSAGGHNDIGIVRLLPDGQIDSTFGNSGRVNFDFSAGSEDEVADLAVLEDGRIIVVGTTTPSGSTDRSVFAMQLHRDGTIDTTFHVDGKTTAQFIPGRGSTATAVEIQSDGKIVIGGTVDRTLPDLDFGAVRLTPSGDLDTMFSSDGRAVVAFDLGGDIVDVVNGMTIDPNGKIILVGSASGPAVANHLAVARLNDIGSLDTTFDDDGRADHLSLPVNPSIAHDAIVTDDAQIVVVGHELDTGSGNENGLIVRFNDDGSSSSSFAFGGTPDERFTDVKLDAGGKYLVGGFTKSNGVSSLTLGRRNSDHSADDGFNRQPFRIRNNTVNDSVGLAIAPNGKIVMAADVIINGDDHDFGVAQLLTSITVNTPNDVVSANDGVCSLREAIEAANTDTASGTVAGECSPGSGPDTIDFDSGLSGVITVDQGRVVASESVKIAGPGAALLAISGADTNQILDLQGNGNQYEISGLTFQDARTTDFGGAIYVRPGANAVIRNSVIRDNSAESGAGIYVFDASVTITDTAIINNSATFGGGLSIQGGSNVLISNTTISGNTASSNGGGIDLVGLSSNQNANLTVLNSTLANNTAIQGANIQVFAISGSQSHFQYRDSIFDLPQVGANLFTSGAGAQSTSLGNNIISDSSMATIGSDLAVTSAQLEPLDLTVSIPVHPLGSLSPAIDGGFGRANLALLGTARQSSATFDNFTQFGPQIGNDGSVSGGGFFMVHTKGAFSDGVADIHPFWEVDLGYEGLIDNVVIHNRTDCPDCLERLRDITVDLFDPQGNLVFTSGLLNPENSLNSPTMLDVPIPNIIGQTVRVTRSSDPDGSGGNMDNADGNDVLHFQEVEVFGTVARDARGNTRPQLSAVDVGAFEFIDLVSPTATITVSDTTLTIGETTDVTITFSEMVSGFDNGDLTIENGTLSTLSTTDNVNFSATLTPAADVDDTTNVITLVSGSIFDVSGNANVGTTVSNNYVVQTAAATLDFGDAPVGFPVTLADDGARHTIGDLFLGQSVDAEREGRPDAEAGVDAVGGDDNDGLDDEDGVTLLANMVATTATSTKSFFAVNVSDAAVTGGNGRLDAWFDFNHNGSWGDVGEQIFNSQDVGPGLNVLSFSIPAGATLGSAAARFRLSPLGGLSPGGAVENGEVEDYVFSIDDGDAGSGVAVEIQLPPADGSFDLATESGEVIVRGGGNAIFQVPQASFDQLTINGGGESHTLSVGDIDAAFANAIRWNLGAGDDRLTLATSGQSLTLTQSDGVEGIESIDLSGSGANSLDVSADYAIANSGTASPLTLIHDADDTVLYSGDDWSVLSPIFTDGRMRHVLANGSARVETLNDRAFHNPLVATDVNRIDGTSVLDALLIINFLTRFDSANIPLTDPTSESELPSEFYDVDRSNSVSVLDALLVINFIVRSGGENESISAPTERSSSVVQQSRFTMPQEQQLFGGEPTVSQQPSASDRSVLILESQTIDQIMADSSKEAFEFNSLLNLLSDKVFIN